MAFDQIWAESVVRDCWDDLRYKGHGNKKAVKLAAKTLLRAIWDESHRKDQRRPGDRTASQTPPTCGSGAD